MLALAYCRQVMILCKKTVLVGPSLGGVGRFCRLAEKLQLIAIGGAVVDLKYGLLAAHLFGTKRSCENPLFLKYDGNGI